MTAVEFIRLLFRHLKFLVLIPLLLTVAVSILTQNTPQKYLSKTMIYTGLASGYTIESGKDTRVDYFAVNNAFDNLINLIKANETLEAAGVHLLAQHLMQTAPNPHILSEELYQQLKTLAPDELRQALVDTTSRLVTALNIQTTRNKDFQSITQNLLAALELPYNLEQFSKISVIRKSNSDMLELNYETTDPAICQNSLKILTEVFIGKFRQLKKSETGTVVDYFIEKTQRAHNELLIKEENLRIFRTKNNIINYYEQTKYVAAQKKELDMEYNKIKMDLAASESSLAELESKMGIRSEIFLKSDDLLNGKKQLSELTSQITLLEVEGNSAEQLTLLKKEAELLKVRLEADIKALFELNHSTVGVQKEKLFESWLTHFLMVDAGKARKKVLRQKQKTHEEKYNLFLPLGSTLARLEREVSVAEKAYLELLHSLNLSKLRQQNIELSADLKVIDPPFFPLKPQPSKRMLLIGLAFMGGLMFCMGVIIALEYFDHSIKTPQRAVEITKLKLAGALPKILAVESNIYFQKLTSYLAEQLIGNMKLALKSNEEAPSTRIFLFVSFQLGEGKSFAAKKVVTKLDAVGKKVLHLRPNDNTNRFAIPSENGHINGSQQSSAFNYSLQNNFYELEDINLLCENRATVNDYDFVILELPALQHSQLPLGLLEKADFSVLVLNANRVWSEADDFCLRSLRAASKNEPLLLLNGVRIEQLEKLIGEIPKKRSRFRIFLKRLARFELQSWAKPSIEA